MKHRITLIHYKVNHNCNKSLKWHFRDISSTELPVKSFFINVVLTHRYSLMALMKADTLSIFFNPGASSNFELMSMEITKKNIALATIYRPLNNIFLNFFMEHLRKKYICKNQIKKGINGVRETIEYIKKNYSVALMIDQRVSEGERINFFGKKALTTTLPAQLSKKFNLDIVPVFIERTREDNFIIKFYSPIQNNKFKNKIELSNELNNVLEKMIIKNPYQWIWTHNRWK